MGFPIERYPKNDVLRLRLSGEMTPENIIALARTIRSDCDTTGVDGVIVDCAATTGTLSAGSIYFTIQEFVQVIGGKIHVAYIHLPTTWLPADEQLGRDVAHNFGGSIESFASEAEAINWLDSHKRPQTND